MKVECRKITIEVDIDEWKQVNTEWQNLKWADKPVKMEHNKFPSLQRFLDNIQLVAQNPAHNLEQRINS